MARPKIKRMVSKPPLFSEFKPLGSQMRFLKGVELSLDEYEAFRLADYEGLSHEEAAEEMEISRSTFTRLIEKSRKKIAELIVNGKYLTIDGGNIHFRKNIIRCNDCGYLFKINFQSSFKNCPDCNSSNLVNLAGGFGHGRCCAKFNNMKGGNNAKS
ncbi:MAG: DUF134 domain-containing protein [Ignavibacteria bacterium]|jgi:predicted DNA-binding protein (UPF0251 family)|nr:DUF134 domain-containing protein [Ignavibacteria bacterium]